MRAVVVTGGKAPGVSRIAAEASLADLVVAADSGLDTALRAGVRPGLVVGDFDSLEDRERLAAFSDDQVVIFPRDKDETDTEIAVRLCRERGAEQIVIVGGGGGQMGHFVGILSMFDRADPPSMWITDTAEFVCISDSLSVSGRVGEVIAFFPLGCETCTIRSTGLRWPLDKVRWSKGDIGASNELSGPVAEIEVLTGRLLMIRDLEA